MPAKKTAAKTAPKAKAGMATVTYTGKGAVKVGRLRWKQNVTRKDGSVIEYHQNKTRRVMPVEEAEKFRDIEGFTVRAAQGTKDDGDDQKVTSSSD